MMEYRTEDTYFSAVLVALGIPITDMILDNAGEKPMVAFYFENNGEIDHIHKMYEFNNLKVDAKTLAMAIKEQKKRVARLLRGVGL